MKDATQIDITNNWGVWFSALVMHLEKFVGPDGLIHPLEISPEVADMIIRWNFNVMAGDENLKSADAMQALAATIGSKAEK